MGMFTEASKSAEFRDAEQRYENSRRCGVITQAVRAQLSGRELITGACVPDVTVSRYFEQMTEDLCLKIVEKSPMLDAEDDTLP